MTGKKKPTDARSSNGVSMEVQTRLGRAVSLHLEGKLKEALRELDEAIASGHATAEVHSARGHVQFELELYEDAAQSYTRLLELDPRHPTATFNLAVSLEKMGKWAQASEFFQKAVELDPKRIEASIGLGVCLLHLDRAQQALETFERVLGQDSTHKTALFGKGVALQLSGNLDEADQRRHRAQRRGTDAEPCGKTVGAEAVFSGGGGGLGDLRVRHRGF
jgi:tetratricopeptide (TPR) repeat protein